MFFTGKAISKLSLIALMISFTMACSTEEPVATAYKKRSGDAVLATESEAKDQDDAGSAEDSSAADEDILLEEDDEAADDSELEEDAEEAAEEVEAGPTPEEIEAQMVAMGTAIYNERCAECHAAVDMSQKAGRTAQQILDAAGVLFHNGVMWPNADEAALLEKALQVP